MLVAVLKDGVFCNLEILCDRCMVDCYILADDEKVKAAFLVAMVDGAPCASTLRSVWLGEVAEDDFEAFKRALPNITAWDSTVQVAGRKDEMGGGDEEEAGEEEGLEPEAEMDGDEGQS